MIYLYPIIMSIFSRMSGGGLGARHLPKGLPELLFGFCFAINAYVHFGPIVSILAWIAALLFMQTGHGTAFHMGRHPEYAIDRKQFLSSFVDPLCRFLKITIGSAAYCWIFMGLKGALIGISGGYQGLLLGILWPLSYEISWRLRNGTALGEWLSGVSAGMILLMENLP